MSLKQRILILFDVDGTLTESRKTASIEMKSFLKDLKTKVTVATVGGSDFIKQQEQLGTDLFEFVDFAFSENGLVAYQNGTLFHQQSLKDFLGEEKIKRLINFLLHYLADLDIPIKRGTFIEFRSGMLNVSPIGRNCSQQERIDFEKYDNQHQIRAKMIEHLKQNFEDYNLHYSIGGQISIDIFPKGWDKTYCLKHVENFNFEQIHFFGDKTQPGGNDYEIFISPKVIGHTVSNPQDTINQLTQLLSTL
eukprot:TRINITY_DN997_c0_g1_i3.p1 TRINITY_DN997_c0_g1~~TRINITY_DN997_c0_g1_i3.p1  ORF type:complete len:279 (-),score=113.78 TRINITY_DN997_c0_g1_i3:68-814(-)